MAKLSISLGCGASDRTRPLLDGRISIEGCETTALPLAAEELFHRSFHSGEFIVSELSMSSYLARRAMGDTRYLAIPVFTSRMFRHSAIYVHAESGINEPEDLRGRCVGVPEYAMTAALWVRAFLEQDFGINPQDLHWRTGGLHQTGRTAKADINLPSSIDVQPIEPNETLDSLLADGRLPAIISARPPQNFRCATGRIRRLFPDYEPLERDYYGRTQIFPIMHVIAIRADYVAKHSWLPSSVLKAFQEAKALALSELQDGSALSVALPWLDSALAKTQAIMGTDFWPYGLEANRTTITAMLNYAYLHGTTKRLLEPEEIFVESTHDGAKE